MRPRDLFRNGTDFGGERVSRHPHPNSLNVQLSERASTEVSPRPPSRAGAKIQGEA